MADKQYYVIYDYEIWSLAEQLRRISRNLSQLMWQNNRDYRESRELFAFFTDLIGEYYMR